ncbi:hypothetical protein N9B19_03780 [Akkermansiaceae bacterium]|nr:hypothetical protein [Akkermansiaceae bacterium]MDA8976773.1 hypothetical protein [bacterium]
MFLFGVKYFLVATGLLSFLHFSSCQSSVQKIATPKPTKANAAVSGKSFATLKRGHGVYLKQCAQCHEHRLPNTISLPAWHGKIDKMSDLAGLSKAEEEDLQAYLDEFSDR